MNKGVSLYLTIIIMSILLAIVLGLSAILISQMKMLKGIENSVVAFYAADTGIEWILQYRNDPINDRPADTCTKLDPCQLDNEAEYYIEATPLALPENFRIKSAGNYQKTKRAIEISY